jgi:hypothetical protein
MKHTYNYYTPKWILPKDWTPPDHSTPLLVTIKVKGGEPSVETYFYQAEQNFHALAGYYEDFPHAVWTVEYFGHTVPDWWIAIAIPWEALPYE